MPYDSEADTPAKTLDRLKALVIDHLKPDSGISEHETLMRVIDMVDIKFALADEKGRAICTANLNAGERC